MNDEVDFAHIAMIFGVLMEAHQHGNMFINIYKAALKELNTIEESLAPKSIQLTVGKVNADEDEIDDDSEEDEDE